MIPSPLYEKSAALTTLVYTFAETYRANLIPATQNRESDTDHSFLLGILAASIAHKFYPTLDIGKITSYALVHDLVEVYAGDTVTIISDSSQKIDKQEREALALKRIKKEFDDTFSWIGNSIESYEKQDTPEARFIRVVDKLLPGLGHIQTDCITFKNFRLAPDEIRMQIQKQTAWVEDYGKDWPEVVELYKNIIEQVLENPFFNQK
ncbi:MAG: HD domain-containing protein [Candidatus Moranbacteria bacterium]|nr:HD domain-containing protein [Candidatus Moranbacteria bacterium]